MRLALLPVDDPQPATVWQKTQFAGAQSNLNISAMQVIRSTTKLQVTGENHDRYMAQIAVRNAREALDEIEALLAGGE